MVSSIANYSTSRETRTIWDPDLIRSKIEKQWQWAQTQMQNEPDDPRFVYTNYQLPEHSMWKPWPVDDFEVGIWTDFGKKCFMQDAHLAKAFDLHLSNGAQHRVQLFGVFDGHGAAGAVASQIVRGSLEGELTRCLQEFNKEGLTDEGIWNALKMTCVRLDEDVQREEVHRGPSGTTATIAMIVDGQLWTANVGDSRTILDNGGTVMQLSEDADPGNERYAHGVHKRDGFVWQKHKKKSSWVVSPFDPDVSRSIWISMTRTIGDRNYGEILSARPKITKKLLSEIEPDSHLVLASDGVFHRASTRQVAQTVHEHREDPVSTLAYNIVCSAAAAGSRDNITALVVKILKSK